MNKTFKVFLMCFAIGLLIVGCGQKEKQPVAAETQVAEKAQTEKSSGTIDVGGGKLNYVIEGSGIPCLVVGSSVYYPRTFSQELRKHFKFIFMDLRHFTPSDDSLEIDKISLSTYADDIEHVRKALGLDRICIMGHSMHSLMAYEYACKYPENTSHVVMIGIFPVGFVEGTKASSKFWAEDASDERKMTHKKNWEQVPAEEIKKLSQSEALIKTYVTNRAMYWYDPTYDCSWIWEGVEANPEVFNQIAMKVLSKYDIMESLPRLKAPVFLALGRYDYVVPYTLWDGVKDKFPNLTYHLFEKSGHTPQLEEQELFDKRLIDWIKSH
ncbi:alpha/beta fold hydrolase [Acidobacteriota bacterium]